MILFRLKPSVSNLLISHRILRAHSVLVNPTTAHPPLARPGPSQLPPRCTPPAFALFLQRRRGQRAPTAQVPKPPYFANVGKRFPRVHRKQQPSHFGEGKGRFPLRKHFIPQPCLSFIQPPTRLTPLKVEPPSPSCLAPQLLAVSSPLLPAFIPQSGTHRFVVQVPARILSFTSSYCALLPDSLAR